MIQEAIALGCIKLFIGIAHHSIFGAIAIASVVQSAKPVRANRSIFHPSMSDHRDRVATSVNPISENINQRRTPHYAQPNFEHSLDVNLYCR